MYLNPVWKMVKEYTWAVRKSVVRIWTSWKRMKDICYSCVESYGYITVISYLVIGFIYLFILFSLLRSSRVNEIINTDILPPLCLGATSLTLPLPFPPIATFYRSWFVTKVGEQAADYTFCYQTYFRMNGSGIF